MNKLIGTMIACTLATSALFAGAKNGVTINNIMIDRQFTDNMVFIETTTGTDPEYAACHTQGTWSFVMDYKNDLDKAMYSALLTAQASQKPLKLVGYGTCKVGFEQLRRIEILNN